MRPWILSLSRAGTAIGLVSLTLVGCDTGSPELESQTTPVATAPDGGLVAPDASTPSPVGTANLRSGEIRLADFKGHYDGTQFVIDSVNPAAEPVEGFGLMAREQQLCVLSIVQDGVPGSGPANTLELVTESQARNGACPAPYDTVPSLCANVTLRSFYADRTRTDVYVRINSLTTPLANPVLNSAASTPGLPSGLGIFSYGNLGLAGSPEAAASRDWVFQTTGASFSFTGSVVTNMAEFANGLDDDCDLRIDEGIAAYANGIACVDSSDCTSTLCQGGICAPTTCSDGAIGAGETDVDCGGVCGASCVGDKICTVGTDCITGQCAGGFCLGATGDACIGNLSCVNQVCNPNANLASAALTFAPEAVAPNAAAVTTSTGAALSDESYSGAIPLGFSFNFFGNRYSNIYVSSNGWASFTAPTSAAYSRSAIPSTGTPNNLIAMWWGDLDPGTAGAITYQSVGAAPNRKFVLNFAGVADFTSGGTPATFQLVLAETANTADIHCTSCTNGGSVSRTQGIENATGTVGLATAGVNNAVATKTNTSIRFTTVTQNGFCAAPTCIDTVDNGNETGVDCGGLCGSNCADGITCSVGADCLRGNCAAGICVSCFDGIKNQTEGDTDCGGTCAVRCGASQTCNVTADCISGICDASNLCVPTGDPGDACTTDNDCDSKVCDAGGPGAQGGYPLTLNGLITAGTPVLDSLGGSLGDDEVSSAIPLGFNFPFYETTQTQVVISSNGWLTFGSSTSSSASTIPSTSTPNGIVSFFGRDLDPSAGGTVTYATVGTAPNREFLVNYNNIPDFGGFDHGPITVQVALQETTGYIDIRCVTCVSGTATAIVGIENMTGTLGIPMPGAAYSVARNLVNTTTRFQTVTKVVGVCLAPTCSDVTANQDESGIDCGGAVCTTRCAAGQACIAGTDCTSTRCENALCSTCTDHVKSGTETDVDCGGVCGSTCADTKVCSANSDCASNRCEGGICTSCTDGVKNGTETDLDCGGICGGTCNFGKMCTAYTDCFTSNCAAGLCGKGATGANCGGGSDCSSQVCVPGIAKGVSDTAADYRLESTASFTPVTFANTDDGTALLQIGFSFPFFTGTFTELSLSTNGLFAFGATASTTYAAALGSTATPNNFVTFFNRDLDAGLATITSGTVGTAPNRKFVIDIRNLEDYYFSIPDHGPISLQIQLNEGTGYIDLMYIVANSATSTVRIGAEGPLVGTTVPDFVALTGYNPGATNFTNKAVRISTFNQYPGLCAAPSCSDATKNQAETDLDCGGECGATCAIGKLCGTASDCNPGATGAAECLLVGTANVCMNCGDGAKNGNEADVDCGGSCATDCVSGQTCGANADCDSNLCVGGLCAGCSDATKNGSETDVDCGGADCGPCFGGKICTANADCLSGSCVGGFCSLGVTASSCNQGDQCLNGVCGGGTIPAANGVAITWNPDSSINDETVGTRASSILGGTSKLGDQTITPAIPLGFTFRYFDQLYTTARINGNGWLSFTATSSADSPPSISPSASVPNAVIAPFWFDANPANGDANTDVRYLTTGTAPNRKFIVNWIKIPYWLDSTDKATFQVILYENGGYVDLNCKDCTLTASTSRAQVVENATGTQAFSAFPNLPAVNPVATNVYSSATLNIPNQTAKRYYTNATNGASCVAPTCSDGVKNQGETDTDCGGAACGATCAPTKVCAADTDCSGLGASCSGGVCRNCADGVTNGAETGLDCGGQCGATCGGGLACNSSADCATSGCTSGLCNLGLTGELCALGNQCANGVCSAPAPVAITTAPDAASLGNITAGTRATSAGSKLGDSGHSDAVTLPFAFNFFGTNYSSVKINGNGWISFDTASTNSHSAPTTSPSTLNPNAVIAGFWFDADATVSTSSDVRYTTVGTAPNRKFIVNYVALPYWLDAADTATFQIALNEADNTVDIFCADCTLTTTSPTRAQILENGAGTVAISAYSKTASSSFSIPNNTGRHYSTGTVKACQAPTATDGVKNGTETDIDCGGTSGVLCASTKACLASTDCGGNNATCTAGFCRNCGDAVKNGTETDVDCGGICGGNCGFNKICSLSTDCASANCAGGVCGLSANGLACSANADCNSGLCYGQALAADRTGGALIGAITDGTVLTLSSADTGYAAAALPFKFRYFGNEFSSVSVGANGYITFGANASGDTPIANNTISAWGGDGYVDQAGTGRVRLNVVGTAPNRIALINYFALSDYGSPYPNAPSNIQIALYETTGYVGVFYDTVGLNAGDTRVQYASNSSGTKLQVGTRGSSGVSTALANGSYTVFNTNAATTVCAPTTCFDFATNGTETALDCGGSCPADCSKGAVCSAGTDCLSGTCTGGFCAGIADASACVLSGSCNSSVCTAGACAAPSCTDTVKNGLESDLDCGGSFCGATCTAGKSCAANSDCAANRCELLACRTCTDGVKTGTESDIDCGGSCVSGLAGKCALGKTCNANSDCGSSTCTGGVCVRPPFDCFDGIKGSNDVNETDVDCGGSDCLNRCTVGKACLVGSDCTTGTCTAGVCAKASTGGSCLSGADCNNGVCSGGAPTASTTAVSYTTPDGTWTTITGLSADSAKTVSPIAIGFPMNYFGNQYTTFDATSNGWMALGTNSVSSTTYALTLPSATASNAIALYAQDSGSSTAPVATYRYKVFGAAPYRKLIYDVTGNRTYYSAATPTYTAQAILYETSGRVEVVCNPCTQYSTTAGTQGVTNSAGTVSGFVTGRNATAFSATDTAVFETVAGRTCAAATNTDGVKNGTETAIDCGGSSGKTCAGGLACLAGADCFSGNCTANVCAKAGTGGACMTNNDCFSANCTVNSGSTPGTCLQAYAGQGCAADGDCLGAGSTCVSNICRSCDDGILNGNEKGIDCGGSCGATCAGGTTCATASDCLSGTCSGSPLKCAPGADASLCTMQSGPAASPRPASAQCTSGVCDVKSGATLTTPIPTYVAPDAASLGNLTAGTRASTTIGGTTVLGDTAQTPAIPLGFNFNFYGASYSSLYIDSNGWVGFASASSTGAAATLPTAGSPNAIIAGYWFDAAPSVNPSGDVRYTTVGTAPNRKFIVNYIGVPFWSTSSAPYTDNVTFQIALSEADNSVEVFCADCTLNYATTRIHGLENATGTAYRSGTSVSATLATSTTFNISNNTGWRYPASSLVGLECKAGTASDFVKNGTETDIDCGGSSGFKCLNAQVCTAAGDCASNSCVSGLCAKVGATGGCLRNSDCVTNSCTVNSGTTLGTCNTGAAGASCLANADCSNNNCAGGVCSLSANGATCAANAECSSGWCFSSTGPGAYLGTYAAITDSVTATSVALSSTTTNTSVPLGFTFKYFGTNYTSAYAVLHGYLTFQASAPTVSSTPADVIVPGTSTTAPNSIFAFWGSNTSATLKYWTEGTAPNRRFLAHYTNVVNATSTTTNPTADYYVILTETTNSIEIQCESCTQTAAATNARAQAVVNSNRTVGYQYPIATTTNTWLTLGGASKWTDLASISATQNTALRRMLYRTNYDSLVCTANPASSKPAAAPCTADSQCASGACNAGTPGVTSKTYLSRSPGASAIGATSATTTNTYLGDTTANGAWLPLGFPISWYGTTYSSIRIAPDGWVAFVSPSGSAYNQTFPSATAPNGVVALWWSDLAQANGFTSAATVPKIFWEQGGTYPNRFFTAYWVNYSHYFPVSTVDGHVRIFENGSRAEVVCNTCGAESSTRTHTQGVESGTGTGTAYFVAGRNPAPAATAISNDRQSFVVNTTSAFCE